MRRSFRGRSGSRTSPVYSLSLILASAQASKKTTKSADSLDTRRARLPRCSASTGVDGRPAVHTIFTFGKSTPCEDSVVFLSIEFRKGSLRPGVTQVTQQMPQVDPYISQLLVYIMQKIKMSHCACFAILLIIQGPSLRENIKF